MSENFPSWGQIVLLLIAGWGILLFSLAALWAANPRASWLTRLAPVGLLSAMLIPMGLQAFASMFLIQTFGVVGFMAFARAVVRRKKRRAVQQVDEDDFTERAPPVRLPPQFSLGHLFTWPLVGATILALALNMPE
jgi:hypothetical protein